MKKACSEFFLGTDEIWQDADFVLDANVLIGIHRVDEKSRSLLLSGLKKRRERLWLPHQFAAEYLDNSSNVLKSHVRGVRSVVRKAKEELSGKLKSLPVSTAVDVEAITAKVNRELERIEREIPEVKNVDTKVQGEIVELYADRVGSAFSSQQLLEIFRNGAVRYDAGMPPGRKDSGKPVNRFGDLVGWHQMIVRAKEKARPLVLITAEKKLDWWKEAEAGSRLPRPELIREFRQESGQLFSAMSESDFFERISREDGKSEKAVESAIKNIEDQLAFSKGLAGLNILTDPHFQAYSGYLKGIQAAFASTPGLTTLTGLGEAYEALNRPSIIMDSSLMMPGVIREVMKASPVNMLGLPAFTNEGPLVPGTLGKDDEKKREGQ